MRLSEIDLTNDQATAFAEWLDGLVKERWQRLQKAEDEKAADELDDQRCVKVVAIAKALGERHGLLEDMDAWEQAGAACTSWEAQAGYFDVDQYFTLDDHWREIWQGAYVEGLEKRAAS